MGHAPDDPGGPLRDSIGVGQNRRWRYAEPAERAAGARAHRGELATTLDDRVGDRRCFFGEHRRRRRVVERFHACRSRDQLLERDCWRQASDKGTGQQFRALSHPPPGARRSTCNYPFKVFRNCQDLSEHRLLKDTRRRSPRRFTLCTGRVTKRFNPACRYPLSGLRTGRPILRSATARPAPPWPPTRSPGPPIRGRRAPPRRSAAEPTRRYRRSRGSAPPGRVRLPRR